MNPGPERIVISAIWMMDNIYRQNQPVWSGYVLCGLRHCNIFEQPGYDKKMQQVQGFLTNHGRFYNRTQGLEFAKKAGQLEGRKKHEPSDQLMSEDLW